MPTDLPVPSQVQNRRDDLKKDGTALLIFYGVGGLVVLLLIAAEALLGVFHGLTVADALFNGASSEILVSGIDPFWPSSPPL